jgi:hypothetical protein
MLRVFFPKGNNVTFHFYCIILSVLFINDPTLYTARVNGLVIGRPPVASFSPTYDPGFGVDGPSVLVPGTVALTSVVTATRSIVAAPDPSESYWVTGTPRAVTRDQVAGSFNY